MLKWAKIIDEETKEVQVGVGVTPEYYQSISMTEMEVERAWNNHWYVEGYAPIQPPIPEPTVQEQVNSLERQFHMYRWQREWILSAESTYSDYTKQIAQQIEELAEQLRD